MKAVRIFGKVTGYVAIIALALFVIAVSLTYIFKDKIISLTVDELNKHLEAKIEVRKIDISLLKKFPKVAIEFQDVVVYEAFNEKKKLATAEDIYLSFDAWDLLSGNYVVSYVSVENGKAELQIDEKGQRNFDILKPSQDTAGGQVSFNLKKVQLKNFDVTYFDHLSRQQYHTLAHNTSAHLEVNGDIYQIGLKGNIFVQSITIGNNELVTNKEVLVYSEQTYNHSKKTFIIKPSTVKVQQSDFDVKGFFTFGDTRYIDLTVEGRKGNIQTLLSLLPGNYNNLKTYNSKGQVYFTADIKGEITEKSNPSINIEFGFSEASLTNPSYGESIENAFLTGNFTNGSSKNTSTSELTLKNFKAGFKGKSFRGNFLIRNLDHPYVEFDLQGAIDIESLLKFYPVKDISNASGQINADVQFKGVLDHVRDKRNDLIQASGEMEIKNVNFTVKGLPHSFKKLTGTFLFNNNDIAISDFSGNIGSSDFTIDGFFKNVISYLTVEGQAILVEADLNSDYININELSRFSNSGQQKEKRVTKGQFPYLEGLEINLTCNIRHLSYDRFQPKNIKGKVRFNQPYFELQNLSMDIAGGSINANTYTTFKSSDNIPSVLNTTFKNLHVDSLFYITENFGQEFITNKNLKGDLSGNLNLFFVLNSNLDIRPSTITADADFSIVDGQLNNFEPLKKLSKFVEEKELENIRFSELKNKVYIKDEVITIPEMEIKSNISNISISGTHNFNNEMDYKLVVPLKNFKKQKQDKDEAFGAIEVTNTGSTNVFLSIKGNSDNFKVSYDTQRTKEKIKDDLKKEKEEFKALFKRKQKEELNHLTEENQNQEQEYFDFDE